MATYTDKLFKFRNGRWEDVLSDEVNVARGVASLFAGRSVACVDRTVSSRVHGGLGAKVGAHSDVRAKGEPTGICPQSVALKGRAQGYTILAAPTVSCT